MNATPPEIQNFLKPFLWGNELTLAIAERSTNGQCYCCGRTLRPGRKDICTAEESRALERRPGGPFCTGSCRKRFKKEQPGAYPGGYSKHRANCHCPGCRESRRQDRAAAAAGGISK